MNLEDEPNATVNITRGGAASVTVDVIGKMLWLEGFARPVDDGQYAVVTREHVEAVLTNLYQVDVPANLVLRWLRQVGLIKYAPALVVPNAPMRFRYTCANPARNKDPKSIEDVDALIAVIASVRQMLGSPPPEPDEDDDPAHAIVATTDDGKEHDHVATLD